MAKQIKKSLLAELTRENKRDIMLAYRCFHVSTGTPKSSFGENFEEILNDAVVDDTKKSLKILDMGAGDVIETILEIRSYNTNKSAQEELKLLAQTFHKLLPSDVYSMIFDGE